MKIWWRMLPSCRPRQSRRAASRGRQGSWAMSSLGKSYQKSCFSMVSFPFRPLTAAMARWYSITKVTHCYLPAGHCALWQGAAHRRDVEKMHRGAECISIPSYGRPPQGAKAKKGIAAESRPIGKRPAWFQSPKGLELSREFLLWCAVQYAIIYYIAYAAGFQAGFFHLPANCNGFLWERI